jgi:hypothetical protein
LQEAFAQELLKIVAALAVGDVIVNSGLAGVDIGTADVEERRRITGGHGAGFFVIHNIVGQAGNLLCVLLGRSQCCEGAYGGHGVRGVMKMYSLSYTDKTPPRQAKSLVCTVERREKDFVGCTKYNVPCTMFEVRRLQRRMSKTMQKPVFRALKRGR